MNQYAEGKYQENTIHSPAQLEDYGCTVSDTPLKFGGHQAIITPCGFASPKYAAYIRHTMVV
jgi:hypothetical protein